MTCIYIIAVAKCFKEDSTMKLRLLTITLLTVSLEVLGQVPDPMTLGTKKAQQNRIKEKVKVERMYVFAVDKKGRIAKKGSLRSEIYFNEFGKSTKSSTYFPDMTIINETEYDDKGNENKMTSKNGAGQTRQILIYEYDANGILLNVKYYNATGQLTSTKEPNEKKEGDYKLSYNTKGEIISKTYSKYDSLEKTYTSRLLTPENEMRYENKYWVNDRMQILEWTIVDNIQNRKSRTVFKYDDKGNKIEELKYEMNGSLTDKFTNTYNDKNLLVESNWYQPADKLTQVSRYEYEF
jgi:hypothetical protein